MARCRCVGFTICEYRTDHIMRSSCPFTHPGDPSCSTQENPAVCGADTEGEGAGGIVHPGRGSTVTQFQGAVEMDM